MGVKRTFVAAEVDNLLAGNNSFTQRPIVPASFWASPGAIGSVTPNTGDFKKLNGVVIVDGVTYPRTHVGIQAAIDAAPVGGTVFLPTGTYVMSGAGSSQITISKQINLVGAGWGSVLEVSAGVGGNIICIAPQGGYVGAVLPGIRLQDFRIAAASGNPGGFGIWLAGTNGTLACTVIEHVNIDPLHDGAIGASAGGQGNGIPRTTVIQNSLLYGGVYGSIVLNNSGDTLQILNNNLAGSGVGISASFEPGASFLTIKGNNIVNLGGAIYINRAAVKTIIEHNEMETAPSYVGLPNNAMVDIEGDATYPAESISITGNGFQMVRGENLNALRINYANRTNISDNFFERVTGGKDIVITANANYTTIGTNQWQAGGPLSSMIDSQDNSTFIAATVLDSFLLSNNMGLSSLDENGVKRCMLMTSADGTVVLNGYHEQKIAQGGDGVLYLYDGANPAHIAGAFSGAASALVNDNTYATVAHFKATQGMDANAAGIANAGAISGATTVAASGKGTFSTLNLGSLPTHADNAAATTAGLVAGDLYRTATGAVMVRY